MTREQRKEIFEIVGIVAIVASLIFLAVEIRQNTESLQAEVRTTNFFGIADTWRIPAENSELTAIMAKDASGEALSQAETFQIQAFWTRVQINIQWAFTELDRADFERELPFQKVTYDIFPSYRSAWHERSSAFDPTFVQYMNENVFLE
jgi:hypothetical protein